MRLFGTLWLWGQFLWTSNGRWCHQEDSTIAMFLVYFPLPSSQLSLLQFLSSALWIPPHVVQHNCPYQDHWWSHLYLILILIDLLTALDPVGHSVLLKSFHEGGSHGSRLTWLHSYRSDCTVSCFQLGKLLLSNPPLLVFLQKSDLRPLFFSLYALFLGNLIKGYGFEYHFTSPLQTTSCQSVLHFLTALLG